MTLFNLTKRHGDGRSLSRMSLRISTNIKLIEEDDVRAILLPPHSTFFFFCFSFQQKQQASISVFTFDLSAVAVAECVLFVLTTNFAIRHSSSPAHIHERFNFKFIFLFWCVNIHFYSFIDLYWPLLPSINGNDFDEVQKILSVRITMNEGKGTKYSDNGECLFNSCLSTLKYSCG